MPIELQSGIVSAAQATKMLPDPGANQHNHREAAQLGQHIKHLKVDQRWIHIGLVVAYAPRINK